MDTSPKAQYDKGKINRQDKDKSVWQGLGVCLNFCGKVCFFNYGLPRCFFKKRRAMTYITKIVLKFVRKDTLKKLYFCIDDLINLIFATQCSQWQAKFKQLAFGAFIAKNLQEFKFSLI